MAFTCLKLARTPFPNVPTKQTSAGKTNSKPSSAQLDFDLSHPARGKQQDSATLETKIPLRTQPRATGRTSTSRFSKKRSAEEFIKSTQSPEEDAIGTESAEPPRKRKDKETPSLEFLAKELIGSDATKRIRRYVLAYNQRAPALLISSGEYKD